jgi:hypothetical protein
MELLSLRHASTRAETELHRIHLQNCVQPERDARPSSPFAIAESYV